MTARPETASQFPSVHEVALAGLLHDIGKLIQRSRRGGLPQSLLDRKSDVLPTRDGRATHWHALWSDWFFDQCDEGALSWPSGADRARVRNLAVFHHRPLQDYRVQPGLALSGLVTLADHMAAGFERKARDAEAEAAWQGDGNVRDRFRRVALEAIVSHVRLEGAAPARLFYLPQPLSPEAVVAGPRPEAAAMEAGYAKLWEGFTAGWNDAVRRTEGDAAAFEEAVLSISERFLWAVPSSTMDQPDVSLHDHSRAVAAFAAAAFRYHEAQGTLGDANALTNRSLPAFRFLVGDLSGLQATLFRLNSESVRGLNKTLRGRSLRFQLIADAALRRVLDALGMPMSAALQTAGGRFLAVVPDLPKLDAELDALRAELDRWFAAQYSCDLALGLAVSSPFAADDLIARPDEKDAAAAEKRAQKVRASLAVASETAKLALLAEQAGTGVLEMSFPSGACRTCAVRPARHKATEDDSEPTLCDACAAERALGGRLPRSRAVVIATEGELGGSPDHLAGLDYLLPTGEGEARHDRGIGWRWMTDTPKHGPAPLRSGPAWVARFGEDISAYADLEEAEAGQIKTFEALARDAREEVEGCKRGREMLALLKGDVDRLGQIFAAGLGGRWSVARAAALSRMMDSYFSLRLPWLLRERFPNSYTVYAGGDDFMLVLPWRDGFALAQALREDFAAFVGHNPGLTFSLGIALFEPRTPISLAAREAEARLEAAKAAGRNRISAIEGAPMSWEVYAAALAQAERLNAWLRAGALSVSMLYRLLALDDARCRVAQGNARPADFAWMARLGYQLARNVQEPQKRDALREMFGLDENWQGADDIRPGVRLAISHALYRNR